MSMLLLKLKESTALWVRKAEIYLAELKWGVFITPMRRQGVKELNREEQDLVISFYIMLPFFLSLKRKVLNRWDWLKWSRELCGLKPLSSWVSRPNSFLNFISMLVFQMYFADFPWGLRWQCDKQLSKDFSPLSYHDFANIHTSAQQLLSFTGMVSVSTFQSG